MHALQDGGPPPPLIVSHTQNRGGRISNQAVVFVHHPGVIHHPHLISAMESSCTRIPFLPELKMLDYVVLITEKSNPIIYPTLFMTTSGLFFHQRQGYEYKGEEISYWHGDSSHCTSSNLLSGDQLNMGVLEIEQAR